MIKEALLAGWCARYSKCIEAYRIPRTIVIVLFVCLSV